MREYVGISGNKRDVAFFRPAIFPLNVPHIPAYLRLVLLIPAQARCIPVATHCGWKGWRGRLAKGAPSALQIAIHQFSLLFRPG